MPEIVEKVILVVVGALLGILLPAVRDFFTRKLRRPNVAIEVGGQEGCIYDNVLIKSYGNGGSVTSTGRDAIFVRARVMNCTGRFASPAKAEGAVGYLAGLECWDAGRGEFVATNYHDFLRLEWSFNKETLGMDLLPGIPVWLDVVYVLPPKLDTDSLVLKLASNPPVNRYGKGFELPGVYRVTVQVSGNNFGARALRFCLFVPESGRPEVLTEAAWLARLSDPAAGQAALPAPLGLSLRRQHGIRCRFRHVAGRRDQGCAAGRGAAADVAVFQDRVRDSAGLMPVPGSSF